jgi:hypothetical protein
MIFVIKKIKAPRLQIDAVRLELLNVMRAEGKIEQRELNKTTASWQGDKPQFETLISLQGGAASALTGPVGNEQGIKKWGWLDQGTRVRYATMSGNWRSKTRQRWFGSGRGRGRVLFVNRKRPRPGIAARGWSEALTLTRKNAFRKSVMAGLQRASQRMWTK